MSKEEPGPTFPHVVQERKEPQVHAELSVAKWGEGVRGAVSGGGLWCRLCQAQNLEP